MIRTDFVSNSSSSSFIIALDTSKCTIKKFIDEVCHKTLEENESNSDLIDYNNNTLLDHNITNLSYHLDNTRLLFLGEAYIGDQVTIYDIDNPPEHIVKDKDYLPQWIENLQDLRNNIEHCGKNGILEEFDSISEIIDDKKIKMTHHKYVGYLTQNKYDRHYDFSLDFDFIEDKIRIDAIKKLMNATWDEAITRKSYHYDIYVIDNDTIKLTEIMIKNGIKIRFDKGLELDTIKKILNDNKTIMYIRVANSGDGWDCDTIYDASEKPSIKLFDDLPVAILATDYL